LSLIELPTHTRVANALESILTEQHILDLLAHTPQPSHSVSLGAIRNRPLDGDGLIVLILSIPTPDQKLALAINLLPARRAICIFTHAPFRVGNSNKPSRATLAANPILAFASATIQNLSHRTSGLGGDGFRACGG